MSEVALYYPLIDPKSKTMLLNSLLYWDELKTIVPADMKDPFENQWTKAACALGVLKPRFVDRYAYEVYKASNEFADDLERAALCNAIREADGTKGIPEGYRIYPGKLSDRLMPQNLSPEWRKRIWVNDTPDSDGCLQMTKGYGWAYMSRLAAAVAESDKLTPFTDHRWCQDVFVDRYADTLKVDQVAANEARLARVAIETICLRPNISLVDVLRFRAKHHDDLNRYRKAVHSFALQVSAAGTEAAQAREIERIVRDEFKPAHEKLGAKLGEAKFDFGLGSTQALCAAGVGFIASGGNPLGALLGLGIGILFSAVKWRVAEERVRNEKPMTYLVDLRTHFQDEADAES
jgi:hypothetical protein